ncbi:Sigma-70 family RNA polymerase sigma factor [Sulfidibacter corallicola]|uniref:Sigma-70 family RNA polymerase sigma factor n=1 Tax=Sulfidibacter corallicola TaxID=2818388 RepID=A0A8A4TNM5_SULCO|nr:sigma-70 family RNA polymerase sigma factor [Sulfidibacter corallicola]QTD50538.1 sigma-70 family RNA polymerase sigma factor [Sulfidibacter corallicola]
MDKTTSIPEHIYTSFFPRFRDYFYHKVQDFPLAEDLASKTLNNANKNWHKFNPSDQPNAWLFAIAKNVYRNYVRDVTRLKRKAPVVPIDALETGPDIDRDPDPEHMVLTRQQLRKTLEYLEKLPEPLRRTFEMHTIHDYDLKKVAALMNIPVGTVKSRINKVRVGLRQWAESHGFTGKKKRTTGVSDEAQPRSRS